jgi:hypothetical protein
MVESWICMKEAPLLCAWHKPSRRKQLFQQQYEDNDDTGRDA